MIRLVSAFHRMSESHRPQRNAKASPTSRRVILFTDLSCRSGRDLSVALDEKIGSAIAGWRLSIRHNTDASPDEIAKLRAAAIIVDGLDSDHVACAQKACRKLINISCATVPGVESLAIDAYLAGADAADILLRRGHRRFIAAENENPLLLSGFVDEIAHAGLTADVVQTATDSDPLPNGAILAETNSHPPGSDCNGESQSNATLICIGRRSTECSFIVEPSAHCLASVLNQWLDDDAMPLPAIPPKPVDAIAVTSLPDAFGDPAISEISAYIDEQLSCGKGCKVDTIASHFSFARRTLERRFRDVTKTSIHKEITRRQVARARQHLFEPGATPATAAAAAGYSSTRMLSINFRKLTGLSPRSYQRKKT